MGLEPVSMSVSSLDRSERERIGALSVGARVGIVVVVGDGMEVGVGIGVKSGRVPVGIANGVGVGAADCPQVATRTREAIIKAHKESF